MRLFFCVNEMGHGLASDGNQHSLGCVSHLHRCKKHLGGPELLGGGREGGGGAKHPPPELQGGKQPLGPGCASHPGASEAGELCIRLGATRPAELGWWGGGLALHPALPRLVPWGEGKGTRRGGGAVGRG